MESMLAHDIEQVVSPPGNLDCWFVHVFMKCYLIWRRRVAPSAW